MPTYVFSGVITPERAWAEFPPISISIAHQEAHIQGAVDIHCHKNQVSCKFTAINIINSVSTLKNILSDMIQIILDSACLETTAATLLDIRSCCCVDTGEVQVFGVSVEEIGIKNSEYKKVEILPTLKLSTENRYFRRALGDFRQSISYAEDTGFYSYRAMESLINFIKISESINDKKQAIKILNSRLNLNTRCIERLRDLGGDTRYGFPEKIA